MSEAMTGVQVTLLTGDHSEGVVPFALPRPPLTRRQLRLWLLGRGISTADIEAAIAALPEGEREAAMIEWQDSSEYRRDHPLLVRLAGDLGLTEAELDAGWAQAVAL
ncbi:hypothetical protein EOD42_08855 [Rhodovarius crocodyli]|uniref:Uncharacterized protein n=1 Tax=Rhodovarius crocodyli TaxID=1979269 RepID=A0A437MJT9_9PROT|nr:hypothetical protein [Rhodovarius crocodyli]RVT97889.1 hypothetical protein EOD42_08855 [Rhodovarius crocodyli]